MITSLIVAIFASQFFALHTDSNPPIDWLVGSKLDRKTQLPLNGSWADADLRLVLLQLSHETRIPLFVDRRVDPNIKIEIESVSKNWEQLLLEIGKPNGCGFCRLEDIYYFGPVTTAFSLNQNYDRLDKWVRKNRKKAMVNWRRPISMSWPRLTEPANHIREVIAPFEINWLNPDAIEFDLWPGAQLPEQPMHLKLALMAASFDKWPKISKSGKKLKFENYRRSSECRYPVSNVDLSSEAQVRLNAKYKSLQFVEKGKTALTLVGSVDNVAKALEEVLEYQIPQNPVPNRDSIATYTAQLKGRRGDILATMASQIGVNLNFEPSFAQLLSQHIEFDVERATVDEIIQKALKNTDLKYRITNEKLLLFK